MAGRKLKTLILPNIYRKWLCMPCIGPSYALQPLLSKTMASIKIFAFLCVIYIMVKSGNGDAALVYI